MCLTCILVGGEITSSRLRLTVLETQYGVPGLATHSQGIREFKQWFYPEWSPRFLVSAGGTARPLVLANIASLIAGELDGIVQK